MNNVIAQMTIAQMTIAEFRAFKKALAVLLRAGIEYNQAIEILTEARHNRARLHRAI